MILRQALHKNLQGFSIATLKLLTALSAISSADWRSIGYLIGDVLPRRDPIRIERRSIGILAHNVLRHPIALCQDFANCVKPVSFYNHYRHAM
jgi:hypothetical protein